MAVTYKKHIFFGYILLISMIITLVLTELASAQALNHEVLIKLAGRGESLKNLN